MLFRSSASNVPLLPLKFLLKVLNETAPDLGDCPMPIQALVLKIEVGSFWANGNILHFVFLIRETKCIFFFGDVLDGFHDFNRIGVEKNRTVFFDDACFLCSYFRQGVAKRRRTVGQDRDVRERGT